MNTKPTFDAQPGPDRDSEIDHAPETWIVRTDSGLRLAVPATMDSISTYVLLEQEHWFEDERSLLARVLRPGMHTLDVGANHGVYALEMARLTRSGLVWAFEPTSVPRSHLQKSVDLNGLQHHVRVVDAALSDAPGTARFLVQANSELNQRDGAAAEGAHETVRLETLDSVLAREAVGLRFGFMKLDAEGDEVRVLAGAKHFFETQSPVVLFELRHGAAINRDLLAAWGGLGYELFRWSAELELLLPFDEEADELDFALNLLAVRPAQQVDLATQGLLVRKVDMALTAEAQPDPQVLQTWCDQPAQAWCGDIDAERLAQPATVNYLRALGQVAMAYFQPGLQPAQRLAGLVQARLMLQPVLEGAEGYGPEAVGLLVHVMHGLGQRRAAVDLTHEFLRHWDGRATLGLPLAPPRRADLQRARSTEPGPWLRQVLGEFAALRATHSSYFAAPAPQLWAALIQHPDHSAEIERRYLLSHMLQDRAPQVDALVRLPDPAHTANPDLWRALIQASRAITRDDLVAPPTTRAHADPAAALLETLPGGLVGIVDVGASSLGEQSEPYSPLVQAGCGRVTGFEPDAAALAELQRQFADSDRHRFFPCFVGDGREAVFHETHWPLTASLFPPAREVLDQYHHLGELVQLKARHEVQTQRLDDLIEAGGMDVLKIDVQGAELQVFDGARQRLDESLCVWTEVEFVPLYQGQPLFAEVDQRLRSHGLQFLCFAGLAHRHLASWPLRGQRPPLRPQQLWADAIYVPDPRRMATLDADRAARMARIAHHMLGAYDLCHAALKRLDEVQGGDWAARYLEAQRLPVRAAAH